MSGPPGPFSGGLWVSCFDHFHPSPSGTSRPSPASTQQDEDAPRVEATRLAVTCGPSTGLTRLTRWQGAVDEAAAPAVFRWDAKRRDCFRVFAVAATPVDDLEVEIRETSSDRLFLSNRNERWVVAPDEGPFCAEHDGTLEARFTTHAGKGELFAWLYGAEKMVEKKPKSAREVAGPSGAKVVHDD